MPSSLNCRWDEGPDAWEREIRRQEVQKGEEARMEETMADVVRGVEPGSATRGPQFPRP